MDGVILLNKPQEMTSFQAVSFCRRIFSEKKAGHTGTLDPNASGLLIVLLGKYTKLAPFCVSNHKTYEADFIFGVHTDTQDIWGNVTERREPAPHSLNELNHAAARFLGTIEQIPPMYSAIKQNGRKLYELARKGKTVERRARRVEISELAVTVNPDGSFHMKAVVSSGTYIRTLIEDYGRELGEFACMKALCRTGIEWLSIENSFTPEQIESGEFSFTDPLEVIDPDIKCMEAADVQPLYHGRAVSLPGREDRVLFTHEGAPVAVYHREEDGLLHCTRGLF